MLQISAMPESFSKGADVVGSVWPEDAVEFEDGIGTAETPRISSTYLAIAQRTTVSVASNCLVN